MLKKRKINNTIKKIKQVKIQGARNIAKAALKAYNLDKTKETKQKLINARPTEPLLVNTLEKYEKVGYKKTLEHFDSAQEKINRYVKKTIKRDSVVFTHCHSTNVVNALIYSHKHKKFEVYNTETRPLFQGRITSKELSKEGIKVTQFVDSAIRVALLKQQHTKKVSAVFLGADAILKSGIVNKIGSALIAETAYENKIPVYIVADSWKYTSHVNLEQRHFHEVWNTRNKKIKIRNPAFEFVPKKFIKSIISELGILSLNKFVKKAEKN